MDENRKGRRKCYTSGKNDCSSLEIPSRIKALFTSAPKIFVDTRKTHRHKFSLPDPSEVDLTTRPKYESKQVEEWRPYSVNEPESW
jgi:hypothetical protein